MTFHEVLKLPLRTFCCHTVLVLMAVLVILAASFYPSDLENGYPVSDGAQNSRFVTGVESYGRHVNTLLPLVAAIVLKDTTGLKQLAAITIVGIIASHGPKRLLNDVEVMGTRLGQRPHSPNSRHNTPSGHSTLAGAGAYYAMRRYSWWFGVVVIPVLLATMYARVMLDQHTISATIAGAVTGMLVAALFSTRMRDFRQRVVGRLSSLFKSEGPQDPPVPLSGLLPNIITVFGICVGLTALRLALQGNIAVALYLLVLAMILDAVDGRLARALNSETRIGAELDTLADFFNFGIATPLIIYFAVFANSPHSNLGWVAVLIFAVCCAFRLARFNVGLVKGKAQADFVGVPAPALACLGLSPLFLMMLGVNVAEEHTIPAMGFVVFCGLLSIGTFPTFSIKAITIPASMQFVFVLFAALLLVCLVAFPWHTLLVGNGLYLAFIPVFASLKSGSKGD